MSKTAQFKLVMGPEDRIRLEEAARRNGCSIAEEVRNRLDLTFESDALADDLRAARALLVLIRWLEKRR